MITNRSNAYCMGYTVISFLFILCFAFQVDVKHNTKYDRERIRRKHRQQK